MMRWVLLLGVLILAGCMSSVEDGRKYNGPDSSYSSERDSQVTAQCIQKQWQEVYKSNPSQIWMTEKDSNGVYTVYAAQFLYIADIKDYGGGSQVTYYHNGDRLWGTKERLINGIKRCL